MTVCLRVRYKASEKQSGFDKQNSFWSSIIKMLSTKTQTLSNEDLERYKEKIVVVDGKDPYTFSYDAKVLPLSVDYDMVLTYLLNTLSFRTGEPVRNHKSLEACKSFERGFVKEVKGRKYKHIYAVFGKVLHSMRLSDPPAECWILIQAVKSTSKEPGEIHSAHCGCTAGAGETCSHVAAVLYALCYARETCLDKKISVTELPAYWTQPSGSAQENLYKPVEDVNFGREVQTSCELREYNLEKSNDELKALILELSKAGQDVAASKAFFKPSELNAEEDDARFYAENMLSFKKMFDADLVGRPLVEIIDHGKEIDWSFTNEDCMLVEELTRGQSSEPLWFKLRYGRVTASQWDHSEKRRSKPLRAVR
ncbi:uncharacterized protein LOC109424817 [Aedes albopictus]|uniref:SWIM-type domain-containing protein n=1 Tax=Aedes albopictus TaxID=7160 RepID=A0ABM1XNE1_AEDAL